MEAYAFKLLKKSKLSAGSLAAMWHLNNTGKPIAKEHRKRFGTIVAAHKCLKGLNAKGLTTTIQIEGKTWHEARHIERH